MDKIRNLEAKTVPAWKNRLTGRVTTERPRLTVLYAATTAPAVSDQDSGEIVGLYPTIDHAAYWAWDLSHRV